MKNLIEGLRKYPDCEMMVELRYHSVKKVADWRLKTSEGTDSRRGGEARLLR
jgi:hypothetical protein